MKKLTFLFSFIVFMMITSSFLIAQSEVKTYEVGFMKVYSSYTFIYDDGIYRKEYAPFSILDKNKNTIMKVGRALDEPFIISLKIGEYFIIEDSNNTPLSKPGTKVIVTPPTLKEIKIN